MGRAVKTALALGAELVVSTDYPRSLCDVPEQAIFCIRPPRLAAHDASMWDVLSDLGQTLHWGRCRLWLTDPGW